MERFTVEGHHICPEFIKPLPYGHPKFMEVYEWAKGKSLSKIVGDLRHERTCVLACMMNELHPGYVHSVRNGLIAIFDQHQYGYFQASLIVRSWLWFLLYDDYRKENTYLHGEMTAEQFLRNLLNPLTVQSAYRQGETIPASLNNSHMNIP